MTVRILIGTAIMAAATLFAMPAFAQDPSLHEVYQAAESGNYAQAQRMMDQVLRDHPNSAKAHYVEAELLAKQGQLSAARAEFSTAERLDPGLSFAKPEAVRELKARIASRGGFGQPVTSGLAPTGGGFPWGVLLLGAGVVALIVAGLRAMSRRNAALVAGSGVATYGPNMPLQPSAANTPGAVAPAGGGMGSALLGGLATGAAVGAGVVAGEALAQHFMGGHHGDGSPPAPLAGEAPSSLPNDMGGTDFGVADSASWDDGLGGVGDDGGGDWS